MPSTREIEQLAHKLRGRRRATVQLWGGQLVVQPIVTTLVAQRGRPACVVGLAGDHEVIGDAVAKALELARRVPEEIPFADVTPARAGVPVPHDAFKLGAEVVDVDSYPDGVHVYPCRPLPDDPSLTGRIEEQRIGLPADVDATRLGAAIREAVDLAAPGTDRQSGPGNALEEGCYWPSEPGPGSATRARGLNGSRPDDAARVAAEEAAAAIASLGYEADYTLGSLRALDELLARGVLAPGEPRPHGWTAEEVDRRLVELGAYVGETLRREVGGRWDGALGLDTRLILSGGTICWPVGLVKKRIDDEGGSLAAYASGLGVGTADRRTPRSKLPRLNRSSPGGRGLRPVPALLERDVLVATDGDALLVWPVHMYELDLCFGRPVERLARSVDDADLGEAIRRAAENVRWAPARRDRLAIAQPLYEPGSFARDAGLTTGEGDFFETLTAVSASFTPAAVRIEPYLAQPESGGLEPATWLATTHDEPASAAAIGRSARHALGIALVSP